MDGIFVEIKSVMVKQVMGVNQYLNTMEFRYSGMDFMLWLLGEFWLDLKSVAEWVQ